MIKKILYACPLLILILSVSSLIEGSIAPGAQTKTTAQLHAEGLSLYNQGKYQDAVTVWLEEFSLDPNNANTANNLGIAYSKLGRQTVAIEYHKKAIELNPQFGHAYYSLGLAHYDLREYDESKNAFLKATQMNYRPGVSFYNLGLAYHHLKDYPNAEASYLKAIQFSYTLEETYYNLGLTYFEWGNYSKALESFREVKKRNPNSPDIDREIKRCNQMLKKSQPSEGSSKGVSKNLSEWTKTPSVVNEIGIQHFVALCVLFLIGIGIFIFFLSKIAKNLKYHS